ncbi:MAG: flippase [Clostridia bacterium]|nr:flippase [Clostridia bacterium]
MKQKSLNLNMLLNAIKGLMGVIFPLITFPYISGILGVENLGRYNFAVSVASYIILLAGLGITNYAIREGARIRENKEKFGKLANQVFTINILSTIFAYLVLAVLILVVPKFHDYTALLLILSSQIIFTAFGTEWMYSIYEEYAYITLRSIIFQIVSIVLMFIFVKTQNDVNIYAIVTVISASGANVFNYIHARKYHRVKLTKNPDFKKHLKPILVLFAMSATVSIYVGSGTTILGFLSGDEAVGIYSVAAKVYTVVKGVFASIVLVSIPRISSLLGGEKKEELTKTVKNIYSMLLTVTMPAVFGVAVLSKEIILIISNEEFLAASPAIIVSAVTMFVCLGAYFWGQAILVPFKKENVVLKATITSAIVNVVLNFVLIPRLNETAPAISTLASETVAFLWCMLVGRKLVGNIDGIKMGIKAIVGCVPIVVFSLVLKPVIANMYLYIVCLIALSGISYLIIELLLKNEVLYDIINKVKTKLIK